jgi:hypothetical protein
MFEKTAFRWPQPSTVVGLGVLAGSFCYLVTGDPVWAGVAAAAVKILVPDNTPGANQAIETLVQPIGEMLRSGAQQAPVVSGDRRVDLQSSSRDSPEK